MDSALIAAISCGSLLYLLWCRLTRTSLSHIPSFPKASWWKGCFDKVWSEDSWSFHQQIEEHYGSVARIPMIFGDEQIYITDPLALHHVTVKEQHTYDETDAFYANNLLVFGKGLLGTGGEMHRKQRKMMNPLFSLKHMKDMLPIFYPIAYQLRDVLLRQVRSGNEEIDTLAWLSKAAMEFVGQGGLGYSFDTLNENKISHYNEAFRRQSAMNYKLMLHRQLLPYVSNIGTASFRRWAITHFPLSAVRAMVGLVDTTHEQSRIVFEEKKRALMEGDEAVQRQIGNGKDILSVLFEANLQANEENRLPEDQLLGQINTFLAAGQNTTSHAIARVLHQLVFYPEAQARLREEVTTARKEHGALDYDELMALPYLDAVCRETLRLFPPVLLVTRVARKDAVMPLLWPIKSADGKSEIKEIPVKKNTQVIISIINTNRSKRIWGEDAEEWKPQRWLKSLPESVAAAHLPGVYSSMMTFNAGGCACIGFKFAELEMKLVLSVLLETFVFGAVGPEIIWKSSTLVYPTVKGDPRSQLPLKLSLVKA